MNCADLVGKTFGKLRVISFVPPHERTRLSNGSMWLCVCNCGVTCEARGDKLASGRKRSCGAHACRYIDQRK